MGLLAQQYKDKQEERELKRRQLALAANEYAPTGLQAPTSPPQLGPQSYDTKLAGYEGGTKNGGMVFNELGSGAFGPFQFMPATYAGVRAKNPSLNLPEDMTKATREQWDQAHNALKAENAAGLQAAGLQPTPDNLYLAHRFGVGGATSVLRSDPNKPLAEVLPIDWQRQNPDMRGQTVGGFRRLAAERMGGAGVPYEVPPDSKPTQYALTLDSLPDFNNIPGGVMSLSPRANPTPSWSAPVMPQPQATMTPAQYTPPSPAPQTAAPAADGPPRLVLPQRPTLDPVDSARLQRLVLSGQADKAAAEYKSILQTQQQMVTKEYEQKLEAWTHARNRAEKDAWEPLTDANAQMKLGKAYDGKAYQYNKVTGEIKPVAGAQVQIDMGGKAVTEIAKQRVQQYEEKIRPAAQGAVNEISSMHTFRQLLDAGAFTGVGAEAKLALARAGELLGLPSDKATNTQAMMGAAAERVLSTVKSLGANPSNADREYLEKAKGGSITFTEAGLRRILDIGERAARDTIKKHSEEVGRIRKLEGIKDLPEEFFSLSDAPDYATWSKANPLPALAPPPPPIDRPPISSFGREVPAPTMTPNQRPPLSSFGRGG